MPRDICCFDVEATGPDPSNDRIFQITIHRMQGDNHALFRSYTWEINSERPIGRGAKKVTGRTDEDFKDKPDFKTLAPSIFEMINGCDLLGYNLRKFDVPILHRQFDEVGIDWDVRSVNIIDALVIFQKKEPRDLTAALKRFCNRDHDGAHGAAADVRATVDVFYGQIAAYPDLAAMSIEQIAEFSSQEKSLDIAGKIYLDEDGFACYAFGKSRGVPVIEDPGFGIWMLRNNFTKDTLTIVERALDGEWSGTPVEAPNDQAK